MFSRTSPSSSPAAHRSPCRGQIASLRSSRHGSAARRAAARSQTSCSAWSTRPAGSPRPSRYASPTRPPTSRSRPVRSAGRPIRRRAFHRLPVARREGDRAPLPFGHGLSYTTFAYEGIVAQRADASGPSDKLDVSVTVRNTGARGGREVVQLYVHEQRPRGPRPLRELKAFAKVSLEPGEARIVRSSSSRATWRSSTPMPAHGSSARCYDILVGSSSRELPLSATVHLAGTGRPPRLGPRVDLPGVAGASARAVPRGRHPQSSRMSSSWATRPSSRCGSSP